MAIKHLVLAALVEGPASGYRLGVRLASRAGLGTHVESARVYAALAELERTAAVVALESRRRDGRSQRLFHLTDDGRTELDRWLDAPVAAAEWLRRPLFAKLAIAGATGRLAVRTLAADLEARRGALEPIWRDDAAASSFERRARERLRRHAEIETALLAALLERARSDAFSSPRMRPPAASASR